MTDGSALLLLLLLLLDGGQTGRHATPTYQNIFSSPCEFLLIFSPPIDDSLLEETILVSIATMHKNNDKQRNGAHNESEVR